MACKVEPSRTIFSLNSSKLRRRAVAGLRVHVHTEGGPDPNHNNNPLHRSSCKVVIMLVFGPLLEGQRTQYWRHLIPKPTSVQSGIRDQTTEILGYLGPLGTLWAVGAHLKAGQAKAPLQGNLLRAATKMLYEPWPRLL